MTKELPHGLERNAQRHPQAEHASMRHNSKYRLDDATIEVDLSEVEGVDESLEGMPVDIEGHFETRENPELGPRWVLKATSAHSEAVSDSGGPESAPPPSV